MDDFGGSKKREVRKQKSPKEVAYVNNHIITENMREREREGERESVCVCVYERECVCERVREREWERVRLRVGWEKERIVQKVERLKCR